MLEPKKEAVNTLLVVGPYRIPVQREQFLRWERHMMRTVGFAKFEIHAEILRRLGICAE